MNEIPHVHMTRESLTHTAMYDYIAAAGEAVHYRASAYIGSGSLLMVPKEKRQLADKMWQTYLELIPAEHRQQFQCVACRGWFNRFATIQLVSWEADKINVTPMFFRPELAGWDDLSDLEKTIVTTLGSMVQAASPDNVVFHRKGQAIDRAPGGVGFNHFYYPNDIDQSVGIKTAEEYAAAKSKLLRFLNAEITLETLTAADRLFTLDVKFAGYSNYVTKIERLIQAKNRLQQADQATRPLWRAVLPLMELRHYRSELIGSFLMEWENSGMESAVRLFNKMVDPREYRKPSALPHSTMVNKAEQVIDMLGVRNSLQFATTSVHDPVIRWLVRYDDTPAAPVTGGLFDALKTKDPRNARVADTVRYDLGAMTFQKAWDKYLTTAKSIELVLSRTSDLPIGVVGVAVNQDSPPILKHDTVEDRYPLAVMLLQPPPDMRRLGFAERAATRITIEGFIDVPNDQNSERAHKLMVFALTGQAQFTLPNLLPHSLIPELQEYWRVIYQYNLTISQTPSPGDAFGFLIPDSAGVEFGSLGIGELELTLADGTLAKLNLTTFD